MLQLFMPLGSAATWACALSAKASVLIGLAVLVRRPLASAAHLRYALWLPVLLCLLCPIGLSLNISALGWERPDRATALLLSASTMSSLTGQDGGVSPMRASPADRTSLSPIGSANLNAESTTSHLRRAAREPLYAFALRSCVLLLPILWIAVAAMLSALYLRNLLRFRRIARAGSAVNASARAVFEQCRDELRLRRRVRLVETAYLESPTLFGWIRPTLLLPLGLSQRLGAMQLRHVFLHELAHVQRHDILVNWLAAWAQTLHWFNPAVWWAVRLMRADMEHACDARVLRQLSASERRDYGNTLVQLADARPPEPAAFALGMADRYADLKERVTMITRFGPASSRAKFAVLLALIGFTSAALTQPALGPSPSSAPAGDHPSNASTSPAAAGYADSSDGRHATDPAGTIGVPMQTLIRQVAANMHEPVIVDPRAVSTVILYGQKLDQIDYSDLLTILRINGFTAVELNHYINIVPLDEVRWLPLPTITAGQSLPADQFASMSLQLKNACAPYLIPILRPTLARYAHFAADVNSNSILAIDTYANLRRLRSVIMQLDARTKPGLRCGPPRAK
jgi:beta-lactamase regulating signal transducer with metallopeptidase domain